MQEDIVGTLHSIGHATAICSLCGAPYPADQVVPVDADPMDGMRSERAEACPECRRALLEGDDPAFPIEVDGEWEVSTAVIP